MKEMIDSEKKMNEEEEEEREILPKLELENFEKPLNFEKSLDFENKAKGLVPKFIESGIFNRL